MVRQGDDGKRIGQPSQTPRACRPPSRASSRRGRAAPAGAPLLSQGIRARERRGGRAGPRAPGSHLAWAEHGDHGGACHCPEREVHAHHVAQEVHGLDERRGVLKVVELRIEERRVCEARHERRDDADGGAVLRVQRQLALANGEQKQLGPALQGSLVGVQHGAASHDSRGLTRQRRGLASHHTARPLGRT